MLVVPDDPLAVLQDLVAVFDEGLRAPLPLVPGASSEYAARRERGSSVQEALAAARAQWDSPYGGDSADRHIVRAHGPSPSFDRLLAEPGEGDEPARFGVLARRLCDPRARGVDAPGRIRTIAPRSEAATPHRIHESKRIEGVSE